ncbi:MAG: hypothetical protein WD136_01765 [Cyanobium sp.]
MPSPVLGFFLDGTTCYLGGVVESKAVALTMGKPALQQISHG